jgi:hypothetical protein
MDDATRAELAELRRRAYGPAPDIATDAAAIDRLVELESLVLEGYAAQFAAQHPVPAVAGGFGDGASPIGPADDGPWAADAPSPDSSPSDADGMPDPGASAAPEEGSVDASNPAPRRGRRGGLALGVALVAVAVVAGTAVTPAPAGGVHVTTESSRSAFTFANDTDAATLIRVPLDGSFGVDLGPPTRSDFPAFPSSAPIDWATNLGDYYGWQLWIGGGDGGPQEQQCILVLRGDTAKGRCVPAEFRQETALIVSIPYLSIAASERPPGFGPGRRIGFWWLEDSAITVLLGNSPTSR